MRRMMLIGLCSLLSLGGLAPVGAFPPAVQVCFQLSPFDDVLRLDAKQPDPTELFFVVGATWNGGVVYQLLGGGTAYGGERLGLQVTLSHETDFFTGNRVCHWHATVDPADVTGPWTLDCQGANPSFVVAGDLFPVPCDGSAISTAPAPRWAGAHP